MTTIDVEFSDNVVPLRSEADRIALAQKLAADRRFFALVKSLRSTPPMDSRDWMSYDWDAAEIVEGK